MRAREKGKGIRPSWYDWATFDQDGFVNGVSSDAPDYIKKAYQDSQEQKKRELEKRIKE